MTPQFLRARAEARLATALTEYRRARDLRHSYGTPARHTMRTLTVIAARTRWSTLHDLLHDDEPTWESLRGEGYDELELRAAGGDR